MHQMKLLLPKKGKTLSPCFLLLLDKRNRVVLGTGSISLFEPIALYFRHSSRGIGVVVSLPRNQYHFTYDEIWWLSKKSENSIHKEITCSQYQYSSLGLGLPAPRVMMATLDQLILMLCFWRIACHCRFYLNEASLHEIVVELFFHVCAKQL